MFSNGVLNNSTEKEKVPIMKNKRLNSGTDEERKAFRIKDDKLFIAKINTYTGVILALMGAYIFFKIIRKISMDKFSFRQLIMKDQKIYKTHEELENIFKRATKINAIKYQIAYTRNELFFIQFYYNETEADINSNPQIPDDSVLRSTEPNSHFFYYRKNLVPAKLHHKFHFYKLNLAGLSEKDINYFEGIFKIKLAEIYEGKYQYILKNELNSHFALNPKEENASLGVRFLKDIDVAERAEDVYTTTYDTTHKNEKLVILIGPKIKSIPRLTTCKFYIENSQHFEGIYRFIEVASSDSLKLITDIPKKYAPNTTLILEGVNIYNKNDPKLSKYKKIKHDSLFYIVRENLGKSEEYLKMNVQSFNKSYEQTLQFFQDSLFSNSILYAPNISQFYIYHAYIKDMAHSVVLIYLDRKYFEEGEIEDFVGQLYKLKAQYPNLFFLLSDAIIPVQANGYNVNPDSPLFIKYINFGANTHNTFDIQSCKYKKPEISKTDEIIKYRLPNYIELVRLIKMK